MFTATEMESGPSYCRKTLVVFSLKGTFASGHMKDLAFSYSFYRIPESHCKIYCCVMCEKPVSISYLIRKVNDVGLG